MMQFSATFDWKLVAALEIAEPTVTLSEKWKRLWNVWTI